MEDIQQHVNACADLERLAAAAVTMGYSSDPVSLPSHHVNTTITSSENHNLPSTSSVIPQYPSDNYMPRNPQYATVRFYQPSAVYDSSRNGFQEMSQQHLITSPYGSSTISNFTVIQRTALQPPISPCNEQFNEILTNKNIPITSGTSDANIHYIESRNISNMNSSALNEPTIITLSQTSGEIDDTPQLSSQTIIQDEPSIKNERRVEQVPIFENKKIIKKRVKCNNSQTNNDLMDNNKKIDDIPDPVEINGKKYYVCSICKEKFIRKYLFRRHQISHTGEKRGALSLETKAEIIRRIKAGEKQVDLAMEYHVGRSTLSFIMKNSNKFLSVLKNGKFLPDTKRLRGAQREDVEEALYEWYKQSISLGVPISGPILCRKAKDFALKLGYQEFKATHGWLDRFKHRKQIVLGRGKTMKDKDQAEEESEEFKQDFADLILPNILIDYNSNDVFHASEIGLMYKVLPDKAFTFKGLRCAGGSHSRKRITILLCTNMTGTEKFPLLVIGKYPKPKCFKHVKSLPVQYLPDGKAWMNNENFSAWLTDLNSWFVQQNRKVLLVVPNLPIHQKCPKYSAIRVVISPSTFVGPSKLGISQALKRSYRRSLLEYFLLSSDENGKLKKRTKKYGLKITLLTCLHKLASAWHSVTDVTITNSFQRSGLGKYGLWGINLASEMSLGTENLDLMHRLKENGMKIPDSFNFDDYISFDDEIQVCHFMDDDDIIASVMKADIESSDSEEEKDENFHTRDNPEGSQRGPLFSEVKANLKIIKNHIASQTKCSEEMLSIFSHLEYLLNKTVSDDNEAINLEDEDFEEN